MMEKTQIKIKKETKYLIECPYCHEYDHSIGHLIDKGGFFGPWYCDQCGKAIFGEIKDRRCFVEKTEKFMENTLVALELPEHSGPIFLIINGMNFNGEDGDLQYLYEEHQCPTNFLHNVVEVIHNGMPDPHGLFNFMKSTKRPDEEIMNYSIDDWMNLFDFKKTLK